LPPFHFEENQLATKGIWEKSWKDLECKTKIVCNAHLAKKIMPLRISKNFTFCQNVCEEAFVL